MFGQSRGWTWTWNDFSWQQLAGRPRPNSIDTRVVQPPYSDHTYFYRLNRKPIAIATHPYDMTDERIAELEGWGAANGLVLELPDWPSWWYPPLTRFLLWRKPWRTGMCFVSA